MPISSFWVTNISKRNVSLSDLNVTIKAFSSVNLLDKRHYAYTLEQLQVSAKSGSLFLKNKMILLREIAPEIKVEQMKVHQTFYDPETKIWYGNNYLPTRKKSILEVKEEKYAELNLSDEQFAEENADIVDTNDKKG